MDNLDMPFTNTGYTFLTAKSIVTPYLSDYGTSKAAIKFVIIAAHDEMSNITPILQLEIVPLFPINIFLPHPILSK